MPSWGRFAANLLERVDSGSLTGTALAAAPFTVPTGERWVVYAIGVRWVSSATVGNRFVAYQLRDVSDVVLLAAQTGAAQAANLTINHFYTLGAARDAAAVGGVGGFSSIQTPFPGPLILSAGEDLRISDAANVDGAGDTARAALMFGRFKL